MTRWEYAHVSLRKEYGDALGQSLNEWGRVGWEVCHVSEQQATWEVLMKRPIEASVMPKSFR